MPNWGRRGKSNTKYLKFRGKAVYAKPYVPDEYNGAQTWKVGMTVTKEMFNEIRESGCQVKKRLAEEVPNIDENTPYVVFTRPTEKEFSDGVTYFTPPCIYNSDNELIVWYENEDGELVRQFKGKQPERMGEPLIIGNGSDIEVTVAVYPAGSFGHGHRFESIKILDLIEWIPPEDENGKKTDTQSKVVDASKKTEKKSTVEEEEDDVFIEEKSKPSKKSTTKEIGW